ncbi:Carcinoembryonic antigen-related cell adhesion molecule 8, partial [Galemys pyrenaicus]
IDQFLPLPPASLLTVWTPPVTAKITVEPEPPNAAEGQDVLLRVRDVPGSPFLYEWFRGSILDSTQLIMSYKVESQTSTPGHAHSGRETVRADGSLLIRNSSEVQLWWEEPSQQSGAPQGNVLSVPGTAVLPKPHITSNNSDPVEHKDPVVLTCEPETQDTTYLWSIRGQSPPDGARLQLSPDNRTLTLLRVTRNDTGPYVCETRNPASAQRSDPLALNVLCCPQIHTARARPRVPLRPKGTTLTLDPGLVVTSCPGKARPAQPEPRRGGDGLPLGRGLGVHEL